MRTALRTLLPLVGIATAVTTWWFASAGSTSFYFPPLADILRAFADNWLFERVGTDLAPSLARFALGLCAALVVGVSVGTALGVMPMLRRALTPQLEFLRSTPPVLLLPPSLLLFGTGSGMKVFVIALGSLWPILLATTAGVRAADAVAIDMGRVFGLSRGARLRSIVLPAALPSVVAGLRSALPIALVLMVISELVASTNGVGYFLVEAQLTYDLTAMWSGVLLLGIIGLLLGLVLAWIDRRVQAVIAPTSRGGQQ